VPYKGVGEVFQGWESDPWDGESQSPPPPPMLDKVSAL